jgi:ADP-ribose pyrophosphatase YjhB (NUDIX family)
MSEPAEPIRRQRLAAYALVLRGSDVLLTQLSKIAPRPGAWTLPGGGLDHGEDPRDGVRREVYEETGLQVEPDRLLDVSSSHFVAQAPRGPREDFHAVRLIFDATAPADAPDPRVVEVDGTTSAAAWVPLADVITGGLDVVRTVQDALAAHARPGTTASLVRRLHDATGLSTPEQPVADPAGWRQRADQLQASLADYVEGAQAGDTVAVADALADLLYGVHGTALVHGIALDAVLAEVHRAHLAAASATDDPAGSANAHAQPDIAGALERVAAIRRATK